RGRASGTGGLRPPAPSRRPPSRVRGGADLVGGWRERSVGSAPTAADRESASGAGWRRCARAARFESRCTPPRTPARSPPLPPPRPAEPCVGESSSWRCPQHVADPADRVHETRLPGGLRLAAQVADVDLQRVRGGPEVIPPHPVEDRRAREHLAGMAHEQFEHQELGAGQLEPTLAATHLVRDGIELEVIEAQNAIVPLPTRPPQQGPQAADKLLAGERLRQITVRAALEAGPPLTTLVA